MAFRGPGSRTPIFKPHSLTRGREAGEEVRLRRRQGISIAEMSSFIFYSSLYQKLYLFYSFLYQKLYLINSDFNPEKDGFEPILKSSSLISS
jgi:hypothetical protein